MTERKTEDLKAMLARKAAEATAHHEQVFAGLRDDLYTRTNASVERHRRAVIVPIGGITVPGQLPDGRPTTVGAVLLTSYRDADGNQFFTRTAPGANFSSPELQALRDQIVSQRKALRALPPQEQRRIAQEYTESNATPPVAQPYRQHLHSEAIGRQFQQLKR